MQQNKAVLITGGAGFIGGNFVCMIHEQKLFPSHMIIVLDSLTEQSNFEFIQHVFEDERFIFIENDIRDDQYDAFNLYAPIEIVFHFAAESHVDRSITSPLEFITTNVTGTANLLNYYMKYGDTENGRFIHVSTDEVYGHLELDEDRIFTEETPYSPRSPYAASKASSDMVALSYYETYGLPVIVTNCSNNYGTGQNREKFIPTILGSFFEGNKIPVYGDGKYVRDWIHVDDHNRGLLKVYESGKIGEKYNIGADQEINNLDLIQHVIDGYTSVFALNKQKQYKAEDFYEFVTDRKGHDRRYAVDSSKLQALGWKPVVDIKEGMQEVARYYYQEYLVQLPSEEDMKKIMKVIKEHRDNMSDDEIKAINDFAEKLRKRR